MKNARTDTEIANALEDVQTAIEVIVAHLGVEDQLRAAVRTKRAKAERSRLEIERSLGYATDPEADSRP